MKLDEIHNKLKPTKPTPEQVVEKIKQIREELKMKKERYETLEQMELEFKRLVEERKVRDLTDNEIEFLQDAELLIKFRRTK
jgi:hypothetical protein